MENRSNSTVLPNNYFILYFFLFSNSVIIKVLENLKKVGWDQGNKLNPLKHIFFSLQADFPLPLIIFYKIFVMTYWHVPSGWRCCCLHLDGIISLIYERIVFYKIFLITYWHIIPNILWVDPIFSQKKFPPRYVDEKGYLWKYLLNWISGLLT